MKTLIWTGIALAALAGPGLVQAQTLSTEPSTTQSAVTTTIAPACAIEGTPRTIEVSVGLNGGVVTGADLNEGGFVKVICNTPTGVISVGSDDMVNTTGQPIVEDTVFTNTIKFTGGARPETATDNSGWRLASRAGNSWGAWQSQIIGQAPTGTNAGPDNTRIANLGISAFDFVNVGLIPTAGDYVGKVCVTVNPSGVPLNAQGDATCS